jgi:tyrosine-protein kinase Etk/Wzc
MNNYQHQLSSPFIEVEEVKKRNFKQIFSQYAYHWPLFALFLILSLGLAYFYVLHTNSIYHITAKISIQDDKKKPENTKEAALQQLNLTTGSKLIESEVEVIKSRPLIRKVVNDLQLWANYSEKQEYKTEDLYKASPIRFELVQQKAKIQDYETKVTIDGPNDFSVLLPDGKTIKANSNTKINSGFGLWRVRPTASIANSIGSTIIITLKDPEKVITNYQTDISTVINSKAPILELDLEDKNPTRGKDVLNHLITAYKNFNVIDKNKETESTLKFINTRLASLTGELTAVERDVEGYKSSVGLTDITSKSQFYLDNVQTTDNRLSEVDVQLNVVNGIEKYVNSPENAGGAPATIGITDPGMIGLVSQLSELQLQKAKLLAITPESNPMFVPIDKQIASVREAIKTNVKGIKTSLINTKRQLSSYNSRFEEGIKSMPGQERQYINIKRQQAIKENLYVYLLQKREEVSMSYASTLTDARVVEQAYFGEPESQKKVPFLLALLCGFILPIGIISVRNSLRDRVMTKKDIELATSAPVMVELLQEKNSMPIVMLNRNAYALGEQIRSLRTDILQVEQYSNSGRVIMFTSSIPGEGKSFVASNIAVSLAAMGRKTIILELDLRRPKVNKIFKLQSDQVGLSNLLNGKCTKEDVIQPSGLHENLDVMLSGPIPENPSELIQSKNMEELIKDLRSEYDNIIIDSPPLHLVTDAMILAPLTDVNLYIVRHDYTPKSELSFIQKQYASGKLPNMHLVFNGVQMDSRFGYALDYGYYQDKTESNPIKALFTNFKSRL